MWRKGIVVAAALMLMLGLVACGGVKTKEISKLDGMTFSVPEAWNEESGDEEQVIFKFGEEGKASVAIQELSTDPSAGPKEFMEYTLDEMDADRVKDNRIEEFKVDGREAASLIVTIGNDEKEMYREMILVIDGKKLIGITVTDLNSNQKEAQASAKTIVDSLKFQ